jgi:hypothetical protein
MLRGMDESLSIKDLQTRRNRLAEDIRAQMRLLAQLRGEVSQLRQDRLSEVTRDFDEQLAGLEQYSPYLCEKHASLIEKLRAEIPQRAESGEEIDLRTIVRRAASGR